MLARMPWDLSCNGHKVTFPSDWNFSPHEARGSRLRRFHSALPCARRLGIPAGLGAEVTSYAEFVAPLGEQLASLGDLANVRTGW